MFIRSNRWRCGSRSPVRYRSRLARAVEFASPTLVPQTERMAACRSATPSCRVPNVCCGRLREKVPCPHERNKRRRPKQNQSGFTSALRKSLGTPQRPSGSVPSVPRIPLVRDPLVSGQDGLSAAKPTASNSKPIAVGFALNSPLLLLRGGEIASRSLSSGRPKAGPVGSQ
jgi:hypothetical protein